MTQQQAGSSALQAQAILKFLANTQILGADAPSFMECVMALRMIAAPPMEPETSR